MLSAAHICSGRSWERWLSVYILIGRHMPCNVCYSVGIQTTKHRDSASHSKEMSWLPSRMFVARQMCLWKTPNSCLIIETFYSDDKSNFGFLENMLSRGLSFIHIPYRLPLGLFLISAMTISLCFTLAGGNLSSKILQMFGQMLSEGHHPFNHNKNLFHDKKTTHFSPQPCIYDIVFYCTDVVNTYFLMLSCTNSINMEENDSEIS